MAIMIYKSFIKSKIDYSLFVFFPRIIRERDKIERLQHKGVQIALGYRNSTPTNVTIAESKLMRLEDRAGFLAMNYWLKIFYIY